ncbi:MAG: hypothetical protein RR550_05595, partial [Rikenellaceae bacterium]
PQACREVAKTISTVTLRPLDRLEDRECFLTCSVLPVLPALLCSSDLAKKRQEIGGLKMPGNGDLLLAKVRSIRLQC